MRLKIYLNKGMYLFTDTHKSRSTLVLSIPEKSGTAQNFFGRKQHHKKPLNGTL
jgi:hypothetical protein